MSLFTSGYVYPRNNNVNSKAFEIPPIISSIAVGAASSVGAHFGMSHGRLFLYQICPQSYLALFGLSSSGYLLNRALMARKEQKLLNGEETTAITCTSNWKSTLGHVCYASMKFMTKALNAVVISTFVSYTVGYYVPRSTLLLLNPIGVFMLRCGLRFKKFIFPIMASLFGWPGPCTCKRICGSEADQHD